MLKTSKIYKLEEIIDVKVDSEIASIEKKLESECHISVSDSNPKIGLKSNSIKIEFIIITLL